MSKYATMKTLSDDNQFVFECPIFNSQTKIASCFTLREMVWMGKPPEVRKGCQMCMKAGKCPINNIIWDMIRVPGFDPYWSATPKLGKLQEKHIAQIERVLINERDLEKAIDAGRISPAEGSKMSKANQMARNTANKMIRNAAEIALVDVKHEAPERKSGAMVQEVSDTIKAAMSGNMSAAVNKAMEDAA